MNCPKVCIVEIAGKGGICHYTYNLAESLTAYAQVEVFTGKHYELDEHPRTFRVYNIFNRFRTNPFSVFYHFFTLKKDRIGSVHFQLSQFPVIILCLLYLVKLSGKRKIIVTAHNVVSHEQKRWEYLIYHRIYTLADTIIVHAEHSRELIGKYFGTLVKKVMVIPHGNYMFFNKDLTPTGSLTKNQKTILFFGYIRKYKGVHYLIKAFAKICETMADARLLIVGKPVEPFKPYQDLIEELGLTGRVTTVLEYVLFAHVKEYFQKAMVVVLPYLAASQSGIVQLAYGFGKPIVATAVGGIPEVVEDGKNGFIVPPSDEQSLADKIMRILGDDILREKMGEHSLILSKTKFSWDAIALKTSMLYKE